MTEFDGKKTDISLLNDGQPNQEPSILFQAGESLSQILVSMLERRYLSNFQLKDWRIEKQEMDKALPLLSEVEVLGRCKQQDDWSKTMPYVLTATHDLGHSYIYSSRSRDTSSFLSWREAYCWKKYSFNCRLFQKPTKCI